MEEPKTSHRVAGECRGLGDVKMAICVAIYIQSQQKGFLLSIAKHLAQDHKVILIARDRGVVKSIAVAAPEFSGRIVVQSEYAPNVDADRVISECLKREEKYGEFFDLVEDPGEINNLWDDKDRQQLKADILHEFLLADIAREPTRMPRIANA